MVLSFAERVGNVGKGGLTRGKRKTKHCEENVEGSIWFNLTKLGF